GIAGVVVDPAPARSARRRPGAPRQNSTALARQLLTQRLPSAPGRVLVNAGHRRLEHPRECGIGEDTRAVEDLQSPARPRRGGSLEQAGWSVERVENQLDLTIRWQKRR